MKKKVLGSALIYTVVNIVNAGVPFLMLPLMTRMLSPDDYGLFAMFSTTITILGAFVGLSMHGAVGIRYFEQEKFHLPSYIRTSLMLLIFSTSIVICIIWFGAGLFTNLTKLPVTWLMTAAVASALQFLALILLVLFQVEDKPVSYGIFRIGQSVMDAGISVGLIYFLAGSWQGRAAGQVAAISFFGALAFFILRYKKWTAGKATIAYAKNLLKFGVPLIPHTIGGLMIALVDRYIVSNLLGLSSAGVYMAGLQIAMAMALISDAFAKAFGPWLNGQLKIGDTRSRQRVVGAIYLSMIGFATLAILFMWILPIAFDFILPPSYAPAKSILPYFVLGNAFLGMYYAVTNLVFFSSQTYRISKITLIVALLSAPLTYLLIRQYGIQGAGLSYAISQFALFLLVWREGAKLFDLPWREVKRSIGIAVGGNRHVG